MDRAEDYIRRCLDGIPKSAYRTRLQGELTDHLALLERDLQGTQAEALERMGDPEALNGAYWAAWLAQPERRHWDLSRFLLGCLISGAGFLCGAALLLFGDTMLALFGIIAGGLHPTPFLTFLHHLGGAVLYFAAFVPCALWLRKAFRRRKHRSAMIGGGLLLSWLVGKGSTVLFFLARFGPDLSPDALKSHAEQFAGSYDGLWFTWPVVLASLLGCAALGWLFGRDKTGAGFH